jgi:large subunit ribosomal protein L9
VSKLGQAGDIKDVKNGFAKNWLIPKGLARPVQQIDLITYQQNLARRDQSQEELKKLEEDLAQKLSDFVLEISTKASAQGRLYQAITVKDIIQKLKTLNILLPKNLLILEKPIKAIGQYEIPIHFTTREPGELKLNVIPSVE